MMVIIMKKMSLNFILFCISFLCFNFILNYFFDFIFNKLYKYEFISFIFKLISGLIGMNFSVKLVFRFFYVDRNNIDKLILCMNGFIILFCLFMTISYGFNDITSIYNIVTYLVLGIISVSFINEYVKKYAGKII